MSTPLYRFKEAVRPDALPAILAGECLPDVESVGILADLDSVRAEFERVRKAFPSERAQWDRHIAVVLHGVLRSLTRRQAADMRFWHWLCTVEMAEFVWLRWHGSVPEDMTVAESQRALSERFLGGPTLHGVSRNSLARLWWCAEALWTPSDGYQLVDLVLSNQDFFQTVFERKFSLYPPAARAFVRVHASSSEAERREAARKLNHHLTTITVEALDEREIEALLSGTRLQDAG